VPTRHEEIAETLTEEILRGRYQPGDRLPSERDLSARFDASRGAVREAIKKLEQLGLADVQPGGARVMAVEDSSLEVLGHLMSLNDLPDVELVEQMMEVMGALMSVAVRGAVARASDQERPRMPFRDNATAGDADAGLVQRFRQLAGPTRCGNRVAIDIENCVVLRLCNCIVTRIREAFCGDCLVVEIQFAG